MDTAEMAGIMALQAKATERIRAWNEAYTQSSGRIRTACVQTFGCQMNEHDSEKLAGMLRRMGYDLVSDYSVSDPAGLADLVLLNTCCVRENAEEKVYGHLGALKGAKKLRPDMVTGVCGCMTEQEHAVREIRQKYRNVDLVFGTRNLHRFPEYLCSVLFDGARRSERSESDGDVAEGVPIERADPFRAWVTVMYGCNNFCSYCIVPYVRGRERSRRSADILAEIRALAEAGTVEITLLGQNVNSYGKDLTENDGCADFADLIRRIADETPIRRIRFMTSHPKDLSDRLIDAMRCTPAVCSQLHLPVQSGSTAVLRRMNRRYTREDYIRLLDKVRTAMPDITLSTDIIVGFPGETDADFEDTLSLVENVRFDSAYTFIYSPRVGTPAASYADAVPEAVVKERFARLLEAQNRISREQNERMTGRTVEVLCEGPSRTNPTRFTGRTEGNKIVNFSAAPGKGDVPRAGTLLPVRVTRAQTWSLEGVYPADAPELYL